MTKKIDTVDQSDDDDILKDLFLDDDNDNDDDGSTPIDSEELKNLKETLADKDKQINGLLQTVKSDRRKRQEMKGQLDQVTTTINSLLAQKEQMTLEPNESSPTATVDGIPVEFDEDGNAFIPQDKLNAIIEPHQHQLQETQEALLLSNQQQTQAAEAQRLIAQMVGQDERYPAIYSKFQNARKWVNDRVIEYQNDNNINNAFTSGEALSRVFRGNDQLFQEFNELYPEFNLAEVATAEDSEWHFESMLANTASRIPELKQPDERFRKVMNKPSGLGKSTNAKGGELTLAEKVASLSATDLMNLPEKQLEALQKYLADEEQRDGIKY